MSMHDEPTKMIDRISIDHYAMLLAVAASTRSEDPHTKVGACALNKDNRVIGLAYNGLPTGITWTPEQWADRDNKRLFMVHAEQNLCSLFTRGDCHTVATSLCPCGPCANLLVAHGVKRVLYRETYGHDGTGLDILNHHGVQVLQITSYDMTLHIVCSCVRGCHCL
tara:strand:+ start:2991 stop:3488 length:498 start_codon:yes stop_codon:yes gene_type:complete